jgi:hypothetical protein
MQAWLAVAVGSLLLLSGSAGAQSLTAENVKEFRSVQAHPAECSRLARQIDHFESMQLRAKELDNQLWIDRTQDHVGMLRGMQAARCPDDVPVDSTAEAFKQLVALAARAALTYFTFGAAGF